MRGHRTPDEHALHYSSAETCAGAGLRGALSTLRLFKYSTFISKNNSINEEGIKKELTQSTAPERGRGGAQGPVNACHSLLHGGKVEAIMA